MACEPRHAAHATHHTPSSLRGQTRRFRRMGDAHPIQRCRGRVPYRPFPCRALRCEPYGAGANRRNWCCLFPPTSHHQRCRQTRRFSSPVFHGLQREWWHQRRRLRLSARLGRVPIVRECFEPREDPVVATIPACPGQDGSSRRQVSRIVPGRRSRSQIS